MAAEKLVTEKSAMLRQQSCLVDFCEETLPTPDSSPRSVRRVSATFIVSAFFLCFLWLTASYSTDAGGISVPLTWQLQDSVSWLSLDDPTSDATEEWSDVAQDRENLQQEEVADGKVEALTKSTDFYQYVWHQTLAWDPDRDGRLMVVGDVHGMVDSLKDLLSRLDFDVEKDTLVFVGDLVGKHPHTIASLQTVDYIRQLDAYSLRGNHDDKVIAWRYWMEEKRRRTFGGHDPNFNYTAWEALYGEENDDEKLLAVPEGWLWGRKHFRIARQLHADAFDWLADLPMTLHIPTLHSFVVHAGMLPASIPSGGYEAPVDDEETEGFFDQGLATTFDIDSQLDSLDPTYFTPSRKVRHQLEASAAKSLLLVKQNRDPATLMDMRAVLEGGQPSPKGKQGVSWHRIWNKAMEQCASARTIEARQLPTSDDDEQDPDDDDMEGNYTDDDDIVLDEADALKSKCQRTNVIYGHWAAENLQINRYTFGLDSGAVFGRALSALVVTGIAAPDEDDTLQVMDVTIDGRKAFVASLACENPRDVLDEA